MCNWEQGWLNYWHPARGKGNIRCSAATDIAQSACEELERAETGYDIELVITEKNKYSREGYEILVSGQKVIIEGSSDRGLLYGAFGFLRKLRCGEIQSDTAVSSEPDQEFRMLNHWDNMDGSIERGYSGNSFFFENDKLIINERTKDYARLLASTGINAAVINNVNVKNAAVRLITDDYLGELAELEELFHSYGISLYLSLDFAASIDIGGLESADPADQKVEAWWEDRMKKVYARIPRLGGFLVKADSEGRPGPFTYGRNQAEGANMLARAVKPYGGKIIWRCFVYNCQQDWRDKKTDRARAAYDYFYDLDGKFADNVILQIKNGPIDFQVREPFMPLFGKLKKTRYIMEVQIAQEYTGQQIDLCYLMPSFREMLETHTGSGESGDTIGDLLRGNTDPETGCGMAAVANTGDDQNWTGNDLAAANLYGFGRLAWDNSLSAEKIAEEWAYQQIVTRDEDRMYVNKTVVGLLMKSWPVYEKYTAPLGVGFMVTPHYHYGPDVDGYEYSRWGTYHRADHKGIGVDRTVKTGTGYAGLYYPLWSEIFENVDECPDELLLFFHHVPYDHVLKSSETVIQHIYNSHFEGYADVLRMIDIWESLRGKISDMVFERVRNRFLMQKENAKEWCDQVNSYFCRKTGIPDQYNRKIY